MWEVLDDPEPICEGCNYPESACRCDNDDIDICPDCEHTYDKCICVIGYDPSDFEE